LTPVANLLPGMLHKFSASDKFATGVNDTGSSNFPLVVSVTPVAKRGLILFANDQHDKHYHIAGTLN
jgi:hypothetical protein